MHVQSQEKLKCDITFFLVFKMHLKITVNVCVQVCLCVFMCVSQRTHVKVGSLLLPCGFQGLESGCQPWLQAPLPTK